MTANIMSNVASAVKETVIFLPLSCSLCKFRLELLESKTICGSTFGSMMGCAPEGAWSLWNSLERTHFW